LSRTWLNDGAEEQKLGLKPQQKIELVEKELGTELGVAVVEELESLVLERN
jgi:hypothetical protein